MLLGTPSRSTHFRLNQAHQLGHRLGIARDQELTFQFKSRLGFRPALPQIADRNRFHG